MNEKNIVAIKDQLVSLGLPADMEFDLRANICLQQSYFQVSHCLVKEQDVMKSVFYFERREDEYCCSYYEACLRKKIFIPDTEISEINVRELDERMAKIDWKIFLHNAKGALQFEAIENIILDLTMLSVSADGSQIADRLKIKFWIDTPLVFLIPNVSTLRNQFEISQRFYFFDGEEQISLDEAYRFLSHRWREKQINKKKLPENVAAAENSDPVNTGSPNKKVNKRKQPK